MKVLHINDKTTISGGVEVYIRDLMPLLEKNAISARWVAIGISHGQAWLRDATGEWDWSGPVGELQTSPIGLWIDPESILHVHSLSEPRLLKELLKLGRVVRHMHEPRMICPGQGKFWAKKEEICIKPFGFHCLLHAYTQKCCNRHPKRLIRQYQNTRYEVDEASQQYAAIISNSGYLKQEALQLGYSPAKIQQVPYFTDITDEPLWPQNQQPIIVFAGRLSRTKGVHYLLRAFDMVSREVPGSELRLLGSGHDEDLFKSLVQELHLDCAVKFLGWSDKATIDQHLNESAVVAFPSIYPEAFGIVGIEAMMRGKPVVGFDVGGVSDWLEDGVSGRLVPVKDTDAFAGALSDVLQNPERARAYGQAGRLSALKHFSPEVHLKKLMEIYHSHPIDGILHG